MPQPSDLPAKDLPDEALKSLDQRLGAAEAAQVRNVSGDTYTAMAQGYRFLGEVVGGVLGGVGLGWLVDHFAGTTPFGLIGGLLIGGGISIFAAVTSAAKSSRIAMERLAPQPSVSKEEDED
jgi:ATP synthase protein I